MNITLPLLRGFVAVVDHGGITAAADALGMSQSSLSSAIARLEAEVGVALFTPEQEAPLSTAGEALLADARRVVNALQVISDGVAQAETGEGGQLSISVPPGLTIWPLPDLLRQLFDLVPTARASVVPAPSSAEAIDALVRGNCELALVTLPSSLPGLLDTPVATEELVLALPRPWKTPAGPATTATLTRLPLIIGNSDAPPSRALDVLIRRGARPHVVVDNVPLAAMPRMVAAGVGAALVPRSVLVTMQLSSVRIVELAEPIRYAIFLSRRTGPMSPLAKVMYALSEEYRPAAT